MINENRHLYQHQELDTDGHYYYFMNNEVEIYPLSVQDTTPISKIILQWREEIGNNGYYLIGNYLFFTYKETKYWVSVSSFSYEWEIISEIIEQLSNYVDDLYYDGGRLD